MRPNLLPFIAQSPVLIPPEVQAKIRALHKQKIYGTKPSLLDDLAKCTLCGVPMRGRSQGHGVLVYKCCEKHDVAIHGKHTEHSGIAPWYNAAAFERAVIAGLARLVRDYGDVWSDELQIDAANRKAAGVSFFADLDNQIDAAEAAFMAAGRELANFIGGAKDEFRKVVLVLSEELVRLREKRSTMVAAHEREIRNLVTDGGDARAFASALDDLVEHVPLRRTSNDAHLFDRIRDHIHSIAILNGPTHLQNLSVTFRLRVAGDGKPELQTIRLSDLQLQQRTISRALQREELRQEVAEQHCELTDEEFATMPHVVSKQEEEPDAARFLLDAIVAASAIGVTTHILLGALSDNPTTARERAFRAHADGKIPIIEAHLRKTRGPDFKIVPVDDSRGVASERARLITARHPAMLISLTRPDAQNTRLTDEQWHYIRDLFISTTNPARNAGVMREALDAYFDLIRQNLPYSFLHTVGGKKSNVERIRFSNRGGLARSVVERLLRLEGWALPKGYEFPQLATNGMPRARISDDEAYEQIAYQLERVVPPNLTSVKGRVVACGGLVIECLDSVITGLDGEKWLSRSRARRLFLTIVDGGGEVISRSALAARLRLTRLEVIQTASILRRQLAKVAPDLDLINVDGGYRLSLPIRTLVP